VGLDVQPQIQAMTQASASSENAPVDSRIQVAGQVVSVDIPAVNYDARGGESKVDFITSALMPSAKGQGE